jgi:hypothetical protein
MPSNSAIITSVPRTGTVVSPILELEVHNVSLYLPHISETVIADLDEGPQYTPTLQNLVLIGVLLSSLLAWWVLLIRAFSALVSALIF